MGQRGAIVMLLFTGGVVMLPVAALSIISLELGRAATPVGVFFLWAGLACLIFAKWPQLRAGDYWSVGPAKLSSGRKQLYWASYAVMACALAIVVFGLRFQG